MVPFAVEEASLHIESALGEFVPEVEVTETQDGIEEKGFSSTAGKEDSEYDTAINENQYITALPQELEVQRKEQDAQTPTEIEESAPERGLKEETSPAIEEEVQIIPPAVPAQHNPPAFKKTLHNTSPHTTNSRRLRPCISLMAPLECEKHPFFEGLSGVTDNIRSLFDELLFIEGDIF